MAQLVKNLPAMQETWVRSVGGGDPLEQEVATHSSILAPVFLLQYSIESHGQRSQAGYSPWDGKESDMAVGLTLQCTHILNHYVAHLNKDKLYCKGPACNPQLTLPCLSLFQHNSLILVIHTPRLF